MAAGRPALYKTPEDLILAVENYFTWVKGECEMVGPTDKVWIRQPEPVTITGLALFLGFESRQSIYDYDKDGEFSYIIKNARLRVENEYEKNLHGDKPTGSIFALKNMGWKDTNRTELTGADGNPLAVVWNEQRTYETKDKRGPSGGAEDEDQYENKSL